MSKKSSGYSDAVDCWLQEINKGSNVRTVTRKSRLDIPVSEALGYRSLTKRVIEGQYLGKVDLIVRYQRLWLAEVNKESNLKTVSEKSRLDIPMSEAVDKESNGRTLSGKVDQIFWSSELYKESLSKVDYIPMSKAVG